MEWALSEAWHLAGTSQPFIRIKREKKKREKERSHSHLLLLPIRDSEAVVAQEVCGLFTVSEQQHAHHAVQGKDSGALRAHSVRDVERSDSVPADLKREAKSLQC